MPRKKKQQPALDWVSRHDSRSLNYPVRAPRILTSTAPITRRLWRMGTVLDQGSEGACVGFGWTAEMLAEPSRPKGRVTAATGSAVALAVYNHAKEIDEFAGVDYSGTSVLAGAKVAQERGWIGSYRWCFGITDVRDAVLQLGPVVIGIPWYNEMYTTLPSGLVKTGGELVGGHCITITGYDPRKTIDGKTREVFRWRNSWGEDYGLKGTAWIESHVLASLLADGGEACVPLNRPATVSLT